MLNAMLNAIYAVAMLCWEGETGAMICITLQPAQHSIAPHNKTAKQIKATATAINPYYMSTFFFLFSTCYTTDTTNNNKRRFFPKGSIIIDQYNGNNS
jgi:hypothetical protein